MRRLTAALSFTLIGLGATGRQAALLLASMGARSIQLIDPGYVMRSDIENEGYLKADFGRPKVQATADLCQQLAPRLEVIEERARFSPKMAVASVVLCCVPTEAGRRTIWRSVLRLCRLWAEARTDGERIRLQLCPENQLRAPVPTKQRKEPNASAGAPLTIATVAAALLVRQVIRYGAGATFATSITLDLIQGLFHEEGPDGG